MNVPKKIVLVTKLTLAVIIISFLYHHSQLQFGLLYIFVKHPMQAIVILCLYYLMVLLHALRWHRLNSVQNLAQKFSLTLVTTYIGIALNNILPGSIGGDLFRLHFVLKKFPGLKVQAILSILVDRIIGLISILMIAIIMTLYYFDIFFTNKSLIAMLITTSTVTTILVGGAIWKNHMKLLRY